MTSQNKPKGVKRKGYVVRVHENALIQMCLSGLEAYSIWHRQKGPRTRLETYGALWGHELSLPGGPTVYSVEMATVDTSAERTHDAVTPVWDALQLKRDVMTSFWPQYDFLGDFHTHPYASTRSWGKGKGTMSSAKGTTTQLSNTHPTGCGRITEWALF